MLSFITFDNSSHVRSGQEREGERRREIEGGREREGERERGRKRERVSALEELG